MSRFNDKFFKDNRKRLAGKLPGHFLVISANSLLQSSADLHFPLRQDSNFWYLTGIDEPDLLLTIDCDSGNAVLFMTEQNDYQKQWDGESNSELLTRTSGIQEISFKSALNQLLSEKLKTNKKIGYLPPLPERVEPYGFYSNPARAKLKKELIEMGCTENELVDIRQELSGLREIKQPQEIDAIQSAIDVTAAALASAKSKLSEFDTEKDIERWLVSQFYQGGGDGEAFDSIVASGPNAAIIHYMKGSGKIKDGDLVLLDVGAKVDGYAADISRAWAIGGKPTARQQELWKVNLDIQSFAFSKLKSGVILKEYQDDVITYAKAKLNDLNCSMHDKDYPHMISHHLGLDVHDAGLYNQPLPENAVITVEPGIYLPDEGLGVRVEDDVVITKTGIKILSEAIPKLL